MPVILDDGTYDDRALSYFLLCLAVECAGWAYLAISCWPGYFRVRLMVCKAKPFKAAAPWLVLAQAVTASLGLLVLGPWTTEIVSAAPTYFAGLRALGETKLAKYEAWHALTEACIFGYAAYTVASTTKPTCDQRLVKTLLEMMYAQAPHLMFRWAVHVGLPAYRARRNRLERAAFEKAKNAPLATLPGHERPEIGLDEEERAQQLRAVASARARAELDVNFHEHQRAYLERRRLKTPMVPVARTDGAARHFFAAQVRKVAPDLEDELLGAAAQQRLELVGRGANGGKGGKATLPPLKGPLGAGSSLGGGTATRSAQGGDRSGRSSGRQSNGGLSSGRQSNGAPSSTRRRVEDRGVDLERGETPQAFFTFRAAAEWTDGEESGRRLETAGR